MTLWQRLRPFRLRLLVLLAVPVVNEENQMQGIVTADDALEMILPEDLKVKLPKMYSR